MDTPEDQAGAAADGQADVKRVSPPAPRAAVPAPAYGVLTADAPDLGRVAGQVVYGRIDLRPDTRPATAAETLAAAPFHYLLPGDAWPEPAAL